MTINGWINCSLPCTDAAITPTKLSYLKICLYLVIRWHHGIPVYVCATTVHSFGYLCIYLRRDNVLHNTSHVLYLKSIISYVFRFRCVGAWACVNGWGILQKAIAINWLREHSPSFIYSFFDFIPFLSIAAKHMKSSGYIKLQPAG